MQVIAKVFFKSGVKILPLIFCTLPCLANLKPPLSLPSARVLPVGVRTFSLKGVIAEGNERIDNFGQRQVLADPFFQELDFATIKKGTLDPLDLASIQAKMDKVGATDTDSFGQTSGVVNLKINATVPVMAYGFTKRLTIAVAVPYTRSSLNVDTGVVQRNRGLYDTFRSELQASGVSLKLQELDQKLADPINYKIWDYGYQPLVSQNANNLGDIKLIARYQAMERDFQNLTVSTEVSLPTGRTADVNKVIDMAGGDGQLDLGFSLNHDWQFSERWSISTEVGHTIQFADEIDKRIPERFDSGLSPDIDSAVSRNLGDMSRIMAAIKWKRAGFSFGTGLGLQYKKRDRYLGSGEIAAFRYGWMEQDSVQNMQSAQASFGYDTVDLYRSGKFMAPMSISIGHSRVLGGKNIIVDPLTTLDFALFF
jgi:hypothetical protein